MANKQTNFGKIFLVVMVGFLFLFGFFVFEKKDVEAQNAASDAASAADAIAVRVLSNPNHYGPAAWYKSKGFSGTPSATTVDGYPAVQDGRTVYVDVGNVIDSAFYTNIYLLSYNQSATKDTSAILSRIAGNWKFNTNLQGSGYCFGACSADTDCSSGSACNAGRCQLSCTNDIDCPSNNFCVSGRCQKNCLEDKDCGNKNYCDSLKAMVTRDTIRLAGISDLKAKLTAYKAKANHYPILSAGSYLPGQSLSTWPSWNGEFAKELGASIGIDPINKLGYCDGYDAETCWDSLGKKFYGTIPDGLPGGSYAYAYSTDANGANYKACAVMESGYTNSDACPGSAASGGSTASKITINCGTLAGVQGQAFSGYVTVTDPKNSGGAITVSGLPSGFSAQAVANNPYQKQIVSANAGSGGTITVSYPNATSKTCTISVSSNAYVVYPVTPTTMNVVLGKTVNFTVSAYNSQKNYSGLVFTIAGTDVNTVCSNIVIDANGRATCNVSFTSSKSFSNETVTVTANDGAKNTYTTQQFTMNVNGKPPVIAAPNCPTAVRLSTAIVKTYYNSSGCQLTASSPTGNTIQSFQGNNLPPGLSISSTGLLSGSPTTAGAYDNISITATDQYGIVSAPVPLHIAVNTYCGDSIKETPNGEQKGGPKNDGTEQCDGTAGVPATPAESAALFAANDGSVFKYGCNSCTLLNDGYCGDNTVQTKYGEQCDLGINSTCCNACQWTTGPMVTTPLPDTGSVAPGSKFNFNIPANRGVGTLSFTAHPNIILNDLSSQPIAIMIISDISNPPNSDPVNGTIANLIKAADNMVDQQYAWSNAKNETVMMGAFGFGSSTTADNTNFHFLTPLGNLLNGAAQQLNLETNIGHYKAFGDGPVSNESYIDKAIPQAKAMLDTMPTNYLKYMIVISDGCSCSSWDTPTTAAANAAKADNIKIYTISYYQKPLEMGDMCAWSSDNGVSSQCYNNNYSYLTASNASDMTPVLTNIQLDILSNITQQFNMTAGPSGGSNVSSAPLKATAGSAIPVQLDLSSLMKCNPSGVGCQTAVSISPLFSGTGLVTIDNMQISILPACK
jgi:hypothetical protein